MSWEDQGRDELGRFGDGKGPEKSKDTSGGGGTSAAAQHAQRVQVVAYGVIAALPKALRARVEAQYHTGNLARLTEAMTAWVEGSSLPDAEFADRFFLRAENDRTVETLHDGRSCSQVGPQPC